MRQRRTRMDLLRFDPTGVYLSQAGLAPEQVSAISPQLDTIRHELCKAETRSKQTGSSDFFSLPENLLTEYTDDRQGSVLGRIFKTANRLHQLVDRVVVIGSGEAQLAARVLMEGCCQPHFNELSRGDRGSKPRMYCQSNQLDNDSLQGLLYLIGAHSNRVARDEKERWCLVVVSKDANAPETEVVVRPFLSALARSVGDDAAMLRQLFVPITGGRGRLHELTDSLGVEERFSIPSGVDEGFSVLSSAGLLPAALVGINVVELLEGATVMNRHFREAAPNENMVFQFVAANHLMETMCGVNLRVLDIWSQALESVGLWYGQLLSGRFGEKRLGVTPVANLLPRDLNSRLHQDLHDKPDKIVNQVTVERCRFDPLNMESDAVDPNQPAEKGERSLPKLLAMTSEHFRNALVNHGRPATRLELPIVDEYHLGQLLQMLMIATEVEARLLGITANSQTAAVTVQKSLSQIAANWL